MNINVLRYSFFGIAGGQEVDHTFTVVKRWSIFCHPFIDFINFSRNFYLKLLQTGVA